MSSESSMTKISAEAIGMAELYALSQEQREAIVRHPLVRPAQELFSRMFQMNHSAQDEAEALLHGLMREAAEELGFVERAEP